jgi:flavin-dependent trigonelline monooxygenase, reductase component
MPVDGKDERGRGDGGGEEEASLRTVMSRFPTGVTIVATTEADGTPIGLTVNSFTSVSLEPPLVLVCINRSANTHDRLIEAASFTVSILSAGQADLAARFAKRPSEGRFEGVEWSMAPSGHPVLAESAAWLDCAIHQVIGAGSHSVVLAEAVAVGLGHDAPLLFHRGSLGPLSG